MAAPIWKAAIEPIGEQSEAEVEAKSEEMTSVNLPENSDSLQQQEILDALPVLVFLERAGEIVFANTEARHALGMADMEWAARPVEDVLWGLSPGRAEPQTHLVSTRKGSPFHATMATRSGRLLSVEGTYSILNSEKSEAIIVAHPSGRVREPKSRLMEDVLASIPEAVAIIHGSHVLYTNPAFTALFGFTAEEASGECLSELIVPETRQIEPTMLDKEVDLKGRVALETVRMNKTGDLLDVALVAAPLKVGDTSVGYVHSFRDISDRKQMEAKLQHDLLFDLPTGLANRALFLDRLTLALSRRTRRRDQDCGILLIDLDRFKEINEVLGSAAGDELLRQFADRLRSCLRPEDSASRLAGDEFGVLVESIVLRNDLEAVAARILHQMDSPFEVFGERVRISASVGVAMASHEHCSAELLVRDADFAMTRAKLDGGGCSQVFDRDLELPLRKSLTDPERELRKVLDRRNYEVWYQPIYRLNSGNLEGFEALLRLRRADGSIDTFRHLLGVAENTGLSITLGRETMNMACRQLRAWSNGITQADLLLTLNLTERQFFHPEMVAQLKKALAANAVNPAQLLFEISESTLSQNHDLSEVILTRMVECGVRLAVDNFGARSASLNQLAQLPIDVVKLSPRLTRGAVSTNRQAAVLESLIQLSRTLGMQVIAQGIESTEELAMLNRMGCELGQGHLFAYALEPLKATVLAGTGRWASAAGA